MLFYRKKLTEIHDIESIEESKRRRQPLSIKFMHKKLKRELKEKFEQQIQQLNESLEPRFKLSKIDIEDIVNSRTLIAEHTGVVPPGDPEVR